MQRPIPQLMTTAEVAARFGVNQKTVRRWTKDGLLHPIRSPGGRSWRFLADEIDRVHSYALRGRP